MTTADASVRCIIYLTVVVVAAEKFGLYIRAAAAATAAATDDLS